MRANYKVRATTKDRMRISRSRISFDRGGRIVAEQNFDSTTPYYLACEIMQDEYPDCDIAVICENCDEFGHLLNPPTL